ncbi:MAG: Tad domain-containing protein [Candidatus Manganitrophus sp.]|nr:MAG: Tad domain-containing protein [Candidatus Manganitrophus sp.]
MLVFFTLIISAILGFGALAIDLGYLTLTRVQMESLTDAAALEGLRQRDSLGDQERRISARRTAAWMIDNDFDPSSDPLGFGAGPELPLTGGLTEPEGISEFGASKRIALTAAPSVYKPDLQLNDAENLAHGDMVSGTFLGGPLRKIRITSGPTFRPPRPPTAQPPPPSWFGSGGRTIDRASTSCPASARRGGRSPFCWGSAH